MPEERYSRAPRFVSIALTNACDLACGFCCAPKHPAYLAFDQVLGWSTELDLNGALGIGFGGGEPTLYPRFAELCANISTNTNLAVSFTTHSHRLTPALCNKLLGHVHYIRVSMDGVGATYEQIRGRSFTQLRKQLQLISGICNFGINVVVNDKTVSQLDEVADFAFRSGATELLLLPEVSTFSVANSTSDHLASWLAKNASRYRLATSSLGITEGVPVADPFFFEKGIRAYAHVNASGYISDTSYYHVGAVRIDSVKGIVAAVAMYEQRECE